MMAMMGSICANGYHVWHPLGTCVLKWANRGLCWIELWLWIGVQFNFTLGALFCEHPQVQFGSDEVDVHHEDDATPWGIEFTHQFPSHMEISRTQVMDFCRKDVEISPPRLCHGWRKSSASVRLAAAGWSFTCYLGLSSSENGGSPM